MIPTAARRSLRRYPALGFLAVAALLASLLPSALRVPLSGPTASAELAPVPGKSDSAQGDLSALGQTSTGGLGAGTGLGGGALSSRSRERAGGDAAVGEAPPSSGTGRNPRNKRCVGNPPRQTEDPLSPACVAYFKGDNFGATWKGVTGDEIRVLLIQNNCVPSDFVFEESTEPRWNAYLRYFNERFQTYDRKVRLFTPRSVTSCSGNTPSAFRAFMQRADAELAPFFVLRPSHLLHPAMADEAARLGIMANAEASSRAFAQRNAPYVVSYRQDLELSVASAVEAVCARLAGRPARFHGDPSQWGTRRKFGLIYARISDPGSAGADLLVRGLRDRCGREAGEVEVGYVQGRGQRREDIFARFRVAGVTTVLYDDVAVTTTLPLANASGWQGEWFNFNPGLEDGALATWGGSQASRFFGVMEERRFGPPAEQHHVRASLEGGYTPPSDGVTNLPLVKDYNSLLLLFTGIQAAGPRLTPASFDRGLRALPARQSRDPFMPSAYFGPGDHSFVKDYAFAWWDPTGQPPGGRSPGCWRLVEDGLRYRPEDWAAGPQGDDGIQQRTPEQPCQAMVSRA